MSRLFEPTHRRGLQRSQSHFLSFFSICSLIYLGGALFSASATTLSSVWFSPTPESDDLADVFEHPEAWKEARNHIDTIVFNAGQLVSHRPDQGPSLLDGLVKADAFRRVTQWGLKTAIAVPALKEWDCDAKQTPKISLRMMKSVVEHGGKVDAIEMDEPLVSALGLNQPICHLEVDAAARRIAAYGEALMSAPLTIRTGAHLEMVDIEAYPSIKVEQIEDWIDALQRHQFRISALHLDVSLGQVAARPDGWSRLVPDLQRLQRFLRTRNVLFGIIIWSGYDPLRHDRDYYSRALDWAGTIHQALGQPDRLIFNSWVTRCAPVGACKGGDFGCTIAGADSLCGRHSVPHNLPESGKDVFSHTRLVLDTLRLFSSDR